MCLMLPLLLNSFFGAFNWYACVLLERARLVLNCTFFEHFDFFFCVCVRQAPTDQQLPLFYLIDSIVKNEGQAFRTLFLPALPQTFVDVYMQSTLWSLLPTFVAFLIDFSL